MTLSKRENHRVHQKLVKRFNKSLEVDTDSLAKRQARESSSLLIGSLGYIPKTTFTYPLESLPLPVPDCKNLSD